MSVYEVPDDYAPCQRMGTYKLSACLGKEPFDDPILAQRAAKRRKGRCAYRCKVCHKWHVGTAR